MVDFFEYNDIASFEFGLIVTGLRTYGAPNRRVETVHVRGRNGDLLIDEGTFDNIIVSYDIAVVQDFEVNARAIAQWLLADGGYHDLWDTYNDDLMRRATYFNAIDFDVESLRKQGKATINFYAKPQRFLTSGNNVTTFTSSGTITNPTSFASKPLLRVYGTGTLIVNGYVITVNSVNSYVDIDCESMQCYKGTTNCNNNVTINKFPVLKSGSNTINLQGVSKVDITPRWWTI